ncbi:Uncharacterised protein [Fusobacterium varium]|nr:hypothetical protein [Fusobacterium varium]VEH37677.1 Uncharacterised protein [Fusobacterium varium]
MKFLFAKDVMQITGLKITKSREIIRDLNGELKEKGYLTIQGRVPEKYFIIDIFQMKVRDSMKTKRNKKSTSRSCNF